MKVRRVCAWCDKELGEVEAVEGPEVTHSICDSCFERESAAAKEAAEARRRRPVGQPELRSRNSAPEGPS